MQRKLSIVMRGAAPLIALASLAVIAACGPPPGAAVTPAPKHLRQLFVAERGLNQVAVLDPSTGGVIRTIPVGKGPTKLSYDGDAHVLWVANAGSGTVNAIDPKTDTVVATITVGSDPEWIDAAQSGGLVYVANHGSQSVSMIDKTTETLFRTYKTAAAPFMVYAGVYEMVSESNGEVEFYDEYSTKSPPNVTLANGLLGAAFTMPGSFSQGYVFFYTQDGVVSQYVASGGGSMLPITNVGHYTLAPGNGTIVADNSEGWQSAVFVLNDTTNTVTDIDAMHSQVSFTAAVGKAPRGVDFGYSTTTNMVYFVADSGDDTVDLLNTATGVLQDRYTLSPGAQPYDVEYVDVTLPAPSPKPSPSPTPTPTPTIAPTATPTPTTHLYVANGSAGNVLEYTAPFSSSSAPSVNVKIGGNVWGVASDSKYVAVEDSTGYIYIFNAPLTSGSSPVAQFQQFQGGAGGAQLLFDSNGNLYTGTQGSMVFEYSPPFGNTSTPSKTINGDSSSFSLAMDYLGNLYVGNLGMNQMDVFASPYTSAPISVTAPGTYGLASYATYLFDADAMDGLVDVYNLPMNASSTPAYTIANTDPHALAVDGTGTLYVGDQHGGSGTGSVDAYAQPLSASSKAAYSITSGLVEPVELWLGP